mmetsp:Transcript_27424/g.54864  ORF Transcript_27424/g.54864 Transcript_27424/m.54864 type:complete len:246 (-) Transcript_27424:189-926(-)
MNDYALSRTVAAGLVGLSPYAYAIFRSHKKVIGSWGDLSSKEGFIIHLLRQEYGTFQLAPSWGLGGSVSLESFARRLIAYLKMFQDDTFQAGCPLISISFLVVVAEKDGKVFPVILSYICYTLFINVLGNLPFTALHMNVLSRMWLQSSVVGYALAGAGASRTCGKIKNKYVRGSVLAALLAAPVYRAKKNFRRLDRSGTTVHGTYAKDLLGQLPRNSLLLLSGDENCNLGPSKPSRRPEYFYLR